MKKYKGIHKDLKRYEPRQNPEKGGKKKGFTPAYELACQLRGSDRWKRVRSLAMSLADGMCLYCYKEPAEEVHHIKGVAKFPDLTFDLDNLCPLGTQCHGFMETRNKRGDDTETQIRDRMERNIGVRSLEDLT